MSQSDGMALFASVDHSNDPGYFIRVLEMARNLPGIPESRPVILDGLRLAEGHEVLEIGCGLGADAVEFARRVGPSGRVVALDLSSVMVDEATRRAAGLDLPLSFATGDIQKLDFPDASFDVCRTERVLLYVPDVDQALSEMVRVTRPDGRVSVFDVDFDTMVIEHPDPEVTAKVVRAIGDGVPNGRLGRQLLRRFRQHGLSEVSLHAQAMTFPMEILEILLVGVLGAAGEPGSTLTRDEAIMWWEGLQSVAESATLVSACTAFIAAGTKPPA